MTFFDEATEEEVDIGSIYSEDGQPEKDEYVEDKERKRPDRSHIRTSGESVLSTLWFGAGTYLVSKRVDPPVGRILQLEAPLAAQEIDKAIAGTFLDKLLQPIFKSADQLESIGAIIALPIMVGLYERKPAIAPLLEGQMKQALAQVMLDAVPLMTKQKAKFRRTARQMADLHEAFQIPLKDEAGVKVDPIDWIFQNWVFQPGYVEDLPDEPEEPEPVKKGQPKFQ